MHPSPHTFAYTHFTIRPATNDDIPAVKEIIFTVLKEYGLRSDEGGKDKDLSDLEKSYFERGGFFGVAVDTGTAAVVGTFGLFPTNASSCELRKMYLRKDVRGKGLGKFILNSAIDIAKEMKYTRITLETISPLREAISLYRQFGFMEVEPKEINDRVDKAFELEL